MSTSLAARRPGSPISAQFCLLVTFAVVAAVWVGVVGSGSRHALLHDAAPVLLAPLALWLFFSERYHVTLAVLLLYLGLLDGVAKLSSGSTLATLGRDVLLYAIVLGAAVRIILRKTRLTVPPFTGLVLAWVAVCVMQLANPVNASFLHAATGLRQHLEFVPLFFFGYFVLRSERRLVALLALLLVIAAANGVVSIVQTSIGVNGLAKWGPGYASLVHGTGAGAASIFVTTTGQIKLRPPALGNAYGFGGLVGLMAVPGALALLSGARRSVKLGLLLAPAMILTTLGIVTSQARLDVVGGLVAVVAFLALTLTSRRGLGVLALTTVLGVAGYFGISAFASNTDNRYSSIAPTRLLGTAVTARQATLATIPTYIARYPLGAGIGSVGPAGGSSIGGAQGSGSGLDAESEFTFLLIEAGIPGLAVMLWFTVAMTAVGVRLRRIADPALQRPLMALVAVWIAIFATWLFGAVTANSPSAPFIWVTGGAFAYWYGEMRAGRLVLRPQRLRRTLALR
jgi:hypothetical protein